MRGEIEDSDSESGMDSDSNADGSSCRVREIKVRGEERTAVASAFDAAALTTPHRPSFARAPSSIALHPLHLSPSLPPPAPPQDIKVQIKPCYRHGEPDSIFVYEGSLDGDGDEGEEDGLGDEEGEKGAGGTAAVRKGKPEIWEIARPTE